jgi:hypothetical protein
VRDVGLRPDPARGAGPGGRPRAARGVGPPRPGGRPPAGRVTPWPNGRTGRSGKGYGP